MIVKFVIWLLNKKRLSFKDKEAITNQLLTSIGSIPTRAIIKTDDRGNLFIRGVPMEGERAVALKDSAEYALQNVALQAVHEEVLYQAVSLGIHQAQNFDQVQFAKAAIWFGQQERKLLETLASAGHANSSLNGDY